MAQPFSDTDGEDSEVETWASMPTRRYDAMWRSKEEDCHRIHYHTTLQSGHKQACSITFQRILCSMLSES